MERYRVFRSGLDSNQGLEHMRDPEAERYVAVYVGKVVLALAEDVVLQGHCLDEVGTGKSCSVGSRERREPEI